MGYIIFPNHLTVVFDLPSGIVSNGLGTLTINEYKVRRLLNSAAVSIRLTRLKPIGPPRAEARQKQIHMQSFRGRGMSRGPKKLEAKG